MKYSIIAAACVLASARMAFGFTYPDFSSTNNLSLVGSATQSGTSIRLTPATPVQLGALWYTTKQYVFNGFDSTFTFRISNGGGVAGGGDGIAFSLQNFSTLSSGTEFGAASNQVAISFNTFNNFGDEPSDNFVGIVTNQYAAVRYSQTFDLNPSPIRLKNGAVHTAQFHYDSSGLDLVLDGSSIFNNVQIPLNMGMDGGGSSWVGFGARCGNAYENADILSWTFTVPEPSALALSLVGAAIFYRKRRAAVARQ